MQLYYSVLCVYWNPVLIHFHYGVLFVDVLYLQEKRRQWSRILSEWVCLNIAQTITVRPLYS